MIRLFNSKFYLQKDGTNFEIDKVGEVTFNDPARRTQVSGLNDQSDRSGLDVISDWDKPSVLTVRVRQISVGLKAEFERIWNARERCALRIVDSDGQMLAIDNATINRLFTQTKIDNGDGNYEEEMEFHTFTYKLTYKPVVV